MEVLSSTIPASPHSSSSLSRRDRVDAVRADGVRADVLVDDGLQVFLCSDG
jgi:hypothetical protein